MEKLVEGVRRFQAEVFPAKRSLFKRLAKGQHPRALFVTCADSRIDPNLLTQTEPGDLFVLRNAGNIVPPYGAVHGGEAGSVEYAVAALRVGHAVVCGHARCGAMAGLLDPKGLHGLPAVARWLEHAEATRRVVAGKYPRLKGEARLRRAVEENVLVQLENLRTHPAVAARLAGGDLQLHGWVYEFETGQVFAFDPEEGEFLPLAREEPPGPARRR